ncbi:MAG TPA: hypothetical protein VLA21_11510, partial [Candidatus Limnocylindria bacterium]|nr:hypothetical protein [Candidatus Limnocylindria bacterium]
MKHPRRLLALLLLLACLPFPALGDEEVSLAQLSPEPSVEPYATPAPTAAPTATIPPGRLFRDGSMQIIVTAGGDMTIGGDVRKR